MCVNAANTREKEDAMTKFDSAREDVLFAHLEELVDTLPEMERYGEELACARNARSAYRAHCYWVGQQRELQTIQGRFEEAVALREKGIEQNDEKIEEEARLAALSFANQKAIRFCAAASAQRDFEKSLEAGGFLSVEEAQASLLSDDAFADLEEKIAAFQKDYAETLRVCQEVLG